MLTLLGSISKTYLRGVIREIGLVEYLCLVSLHGFHFHLVGRILPWPVPATVYAVIIQYTPAKNNCQKLLQVLQLSCWFVHNMFCSMWSEWAWTILCIMSYRKHFPMPVLQHSLLVVNLGLQLSTETIPVGPLDRLSSFSRIHTKLTEIWGQQQSEILFCNIEVVYLSVFWSRFTQSAAILLCFEWERRNSITSLSKLVLGAKLPVANHISSQPRSVLNLKQKWQHFMWKYLHHPIKLNFCLP